VFGHKNGSVTRQDLGWSHSEQGKRSHPRNCTCEQARR